jgi:hypothetical protein
MSHRFIRPALAFAVVLALAGCHFGSATDRINQALPPGAQFLTAKDKLLAAATAQALDAKAIEAELAARMQQRAAGCAGDFKPGLFDNDDAIREKLTDKECFAKADAGLVEWLGLRRIAIALDAPPLRPVPKTLGTIETAGSASSLVFAGRAGVAVTARSAKTEVFDIGSGARIFEYERKATGALSSNGRVYAAQDGDVLQLRDVGSDDLLLALHDTEVQSFRFLGDTGALMTVKDDDGGRRRIEYFDFRSGRRAPVAIDEYVVDNVVPLPGDGTRFLASTYVQLIELQVVKGPKGSEVEVRRKLPSPGGMSGGRVSVTADGKSLLRLAANRIEVLDFASMTPRGILLSPMRPLDVVPTADPDKWVVSVYVAGDYKPQAYLYSMAARTLAPVDRTRAWARIAWVPTLKRNAMLDNTHLVPLDAIPVGETEDANVVIERAAQATPPGPFAAPSAAMTAETAAIEAARAAAMASASVSRDPTIGARREAIERTIRDNNLPPEEAARLRQWVADIEAKSASRNAAAPRFTPPPAPAPRSTPGGILRIPSNADVRAVGVYEAADGSHGVGQASKSGTVRVFVSRSSRPIVLVLSSYEPVNWVLQLQDGAKVSNILLSSYNSSQAFGASGARIDSIGTQCAYKRGSSEFQALDAQVERFTGKRIGSFQGAYSGTSFSLGY